MSVAEPAIADEKSLPAEVDVETEISNSAQSVVDAEQVGVNYGTITTYASVARAYPFSNRLEKLSFKQHFRAVAVEAESERLEWLDRAVTS